MANSPSKAVVNTQLFQDVFHASPIGIVVENLDGQPLFINPAFCEILGFTEDELRTKHCVDFSPPEDAQKDWALFQQLRAGTINHYRLEKRYFRRDGSLVWGSLSVSVLKGHPSPLVIAMVEDITEKKAAEEARFRHAAIVESSQDAIISKDLSGIIVSWNSGAQRIFGYTEAEAVGRPIRILIPPELQGEEDKILETLKAGDRIEHYETIRVSKTGKKVEVSLIIGPIKNSFGKVVGFTKIAHDISARKRAEEFLRETNRTLEKQTATLQAHEELLKTFVKNVPVGVAMLDRDMRYVQVSDRWCTDYLTGRARVLGCSHYEIFPDMPERWKEVHRRALQGETLRADEDRWDGQDGTRWARWEVRPWQTVDGAIGGILIFAEDITERKRAEEALRNSEAQFRSVFRDAGIGMVIVSPEGRYLSANPTFCECLGYTEQELLGMTVESITFPEDWPGFAEKLSGALLEGRGFQWLQKRCLHKSGRIVYTETSTSVIRSGEGKPLFFVGQVLDVTSRMKAEEALSDMTRKFVEAQEQERARIARELHDDINQRLALLAVQFDQLRNSPSDVQNRVNDLQKQTIEISHDVQTLSHHLHSSKLEYLGVITAMKSLCREVAKTQKMEVTFKADVASLLPPEIGLSLFRILQEALQNAAKYSGSKRVDVQLAEVSNEIHLVVSDSGKGFDVEAALQGDGLGLTSMRERVRLVNGKLTIESKPTRGTEIHVYVPRHSQRISDLIAS